MYNPMLDTFIVVADCGSFTKASDQLYISPTAIMKQMNTLESHLNLKLLKRTPAGVCLTPARRGRLSGCKIYDRLLTKSLVSAQCCRTYLRYHILRGHISADPAKPFMDLWYQVNQSFPNYKLHLVPFEDNHEGILSEIQKLGEKFDFLIGVCDSKAWLSFCRFLPLGRYRKMVAVTREHRLATKSRIDLKDLYGETLMMSCRGDSGVNDFIRNDLEKNHPQIHIEDTPQFYDLSVFNRCAETGNVLLTIECWQEVHPGLVSIPVNWDYSIPYGLLYSLNAPEDVLEFVKAAEKMSSEE